MDAATLTAELDRRATEAITKEANAKARLIEILQSEDAEHAAGPMADFLKAQGEAKPWHAVRNAQEAGKAIIDATRREVERATTRLLSARESSYYGIHAEKGRADRDGMRKFLSLVPYLLQDCDA